MKIKLLRCCAGLKFSFSAGEIAIIDSETAMDLIQAGYAEEVKPSAESEIPAGDAGEDTVLAADTDNSEIVEDASEEIVMTADIEEVKPSGKGNRSARKRADNS